MMNRNISPRAEGRVKAALFRKFLSTCNDQQVQQINAAQEIADECERSFKDAKSEVEALVRKILD